MSKILETLEQRYNVRFSYADKSITDITLKIPNADLSLEGALNYLRNKTQLIFNALDSRFISVEKRQEKVNPNDYTLQRLDEIIIQNYLTKGLAKSINGTIEIAPQDFEILPGLIEPDILQTIQSLPGITSADELISNINIRGGTNDQNLVLYEGIRMYQTGHFFGLISAFNPYLIDKVTITKNGTNAKYGSGISSLISIENSNEIDKNYKAGLGANLLSVDGFTKIQFSKKTELQLSARRSFTDLISSPTYDAYLDRIFRDSELNATSNPRAKQDERFFFYDINAKFLYDIDKDSKLRFNIINIFNRLDYNQEFSNRGNLPQQTISQLDQSSYAASIAYNKKWSKSTETNTQIYFSKYNLDAFSENSIADQQLLQENKVEDIGIRFDLLKAVDKNINLNSGYQYNEIGVSNLEDVSNPRFRSFIKEVVRTHALYSEAEFTSNSKNTYGRIGLRGNYFENFGDFIFEPRLAFNQKFLDHFRLEILAETKSQTITQIIDLQQDFFGIEKRRWQLSNDDTVPVIKSDQLSVGLNYSNKGWLINVEAYIKNVDGITTRSQGFQNQFQFVNSTGNYQAKGFDLLVNKKFNSLSTWLSYSYSENDYEFEDLNNGNTFPNNIDLTHIINASLAYTINDFKLAASVNWRTGKPFTSPQENQDTSIDRILYNAPNSERLPDYLRTDISATYTFKFSETINAEVGASIWNLLNKENIINRFFTLDDTDTIIQNDNTALDFTTNFSFRLNF
ncbi:TonB-dependent receptor plug domain-containing protein [Winogradskyella immobilis]|uniref:TonB-dependent receptor plug domain-containing protein n=1 Tax=Winogradskyella immobilis TaxID=2816852 RepID=UPI001D0CC966|nr:TonB-dependent receptor [Winogradskyella immobilis]MCG0016746.1 TonB-dependent receptor [Winogradskyella immobilis]